MVNTLGMSTGDKFTIHASDLSEVEVSYSGDRVPQGAIEFSVNGVNLEPDVPKSQKVRMRGLVVARYAKDGDKAELAFRAVPVGGE